MIRSGLVSVTFRQLSPREIVSLVRDAKLDGIEWGGDVHVPHGDLARAREVAELTRDAGLTVAAYGSYYRAGPGGPSEVSFAQVLETALELGAPLIRVWAGTAGSDAATDENRASVVEDLRRIAGQAGQRNVRVALEFHTGTLNDTNASSRRLLDEVGHQNLFSYWQPLLGMDDPTCRAGIEMLGQRLSHLHVFHWTGARERRALAGGADRWSTFLKLAAGLGGDRFAMLEFVEADLPESFRRDADTLRRWLDDLAG